MSSPNTTMRSFLIDKSLRYSSRSVSNFGLPRPLVEWESPRCRNRVMAAGISYDRQRLAAESGDTYGRLNFGQRFAFDTIYSAVRRGQPKQFFLTGAGGTGKTFLYESLCAKIRSDDKIVVAVASTGVSAQLLPGGRTSHSIFGIPVPIVESSTCGIGKNSDVAELLRNTHLIIWDEVVMRHRYCFEAVDRMLRDVRETDTVFGGVPVVLGGDWQQTLPVVPGGGRTHVCGASLQASSIWEHLDHLTLTENMRLHHADGRTAEYANWLSRVGKDADAQGSIEIPHYLSCHDNLHDFIRLIFPPQQLINALHDPHNSTFL